MQHSRFGYSAISEFEQCPLKYKLNHIDHLDVLDEYDPQDALKIGTALHRSIEADFKTASEEYFNSYPIITDQHITEMMKVEIQSKKVKEMIDSGNPLKHETKVITGDFIGTIDLLEDLGGGHFNMYDFKYTNNPNNYKNSIQMLIYKHFYEKVHPYHHIDRMFFIIVPKSNIRQGKEETLQEFRKRVVEDLKGKDPILIESAYEGLNQYFETVEKIKNTKVFAKTQNQFCDWCKYKNYCMKGENYMLLPSTDRRQVSAPIKRKLWIYGATMSGKTTFVDSAPTPLNLNTDGNIQFVTMPTLPIKDIVTTEGRITKRTFAWEVFKDTIAELEKGSGFKTIVVDLLEDTYESCRLYMYDKLGITHESDDSFRAWDKVRTEFLSTIRRLMNLDYENIILISHEDMSKDITKKSGDKITSIKPNINEKVSNKIAGMVDIVARVVVEDDGSRTLNFSSNEVVFGGGRLKNLQTTQIPLDWDELMKVYNCKGVVKKEEAPKKTKKDEGFVNIPNGIEEEVQEQAEEPEVVDTPPRMRRSRTKVEEEPVQINELTHTAYFKTADGNFIKKNAGELAPEDAEEITEVEWIEGASSLARNGSEEEPKRRTRRTRA